MPTWDSIGFPVCVALTVAGLIASWFVWRKSGARRGTRAVAWSLLPLAIYLVGAVRLVGRIGAAVVRFAGGFVFSPKSWAGVALLAAAALILLSTGGIPLLGRRKGRSSKQELEPAAGARTPVATTPAKRAKPGKAPAADDDLGDVEEILRRHGIK
jgi:hypothetical protein